MARTAFGRRLREAREAAGYTQEGLAKAVKVTGGYISQLETGLRKHPRSNVLFALARVLDVDVNWLQTGEAA